jgi:tRNA U55 pseudouridine synthase TruB
MLLFVPLFFFAFSSILEVHACNESESYLGILIHEIAIHMKSLAHCTQIRCIRQSYFTLDDALVKRHWNVETILHNMKRCREIIRKHPEMLEQLSPTLENIENIDDSNK